VIFERTSLHHSITPSLHQKRFIPRKLQFIQKNRALVGSMFCKLLKENTFAALKQKQKDGCERLFIHHYND